MGFFATGRSVQGNSGGGVYARGRLVGVVWGNPQGGTAFIPIGPVRSLINRVIGRPDAIITPPSPASPQFPRKPTEPPPTTNPTPPENTDSVLPIGLLDKLTLGKILAGSLGLSTPVAIAAVAVGALFRRRLQKNRRDVTTVAERDTRPLQPSLPPAVNSRGLLHGVEELPPAERAHYELPTHYRTEQTNRYVDVLSDDFLSRGFREAVAREIEVNPQYSELLQRVERNADRYAKGYHTSARIKA